MGGRTRYEKDRPVDDCEADEARAYHTLGELVSHRSSLELDARTRRALSEVLHATAIELSAGRAVPIGLRRAVWSVANALRIALDSATDSTTPGSPNTSAQRVGISASGVTPPHFTAADPS